MSTETELMAWRYGSTQSERLAAAILRLEAYEEIEPRAPLGGGDGRADILCTRGRLRWVAAVYFPPTTQSFEDVEAKFDHDLEGPKRHSRQGLVFITNQRLTLPQRDNLVERALQRNIECVTYDVERIRGVLDSPEGYGLRIAYLRIPMSPEEQLAYFARSETAIDRNTAELNRIARLVSGLYASQRYAVETVRSLASAAGLDEKLQPPPRIDQLSLDKIETQTGVPALSAALNPELTLAFHRVVAFDLPGRMLGRYRDVQVDIRATLGPSYTATQQPPSPEQIPALVYALCKEWREGFEAISSAKQETKLQAIASFFFNFLSIHPFLDGNGRTARSLLMQQCLDLFGYVDMGRFERGADYYEAIRAADGGDTRPLVALIQKVLE